MITWLNWYRLGFSTVDSIFLFVFDKYLGGDTLKVCKYCFSSNFYLLILAFIGEDCDIYYDGGILLLKLFQLWPLGTSSCWLLCSFDLIYLFIYLAFPYFLALLRCSWLTLILPGPALESVTSPGIPGFQDLGTSLFIFFSRLSLLVGPLSR